MKRKKQNLEHTQKSTRCKKKNNEKLVTNSVQLSKEKLKATITKKNTPKIPEICKNKNKREYVKTGITGLDGMFELGIPKGTAILVAGGAGSGKTIMCLQILANACMRGEKCLYMSFEESEERLRQHMEDFGWNVPEFEKKKLLMLKRFNLFDIARSIDALLEKANGELLIDVEPIILPDGFKPDWIIVDSLTSICSAFTKKSNTYRSYIEQLFRYFEKLGVNSFMISETKEIPTVFSPAGVEEFLADGVIVLYNIRKGNVRESAMEVLKMRGTKHRKNIVAMQIIGGTGIEIYPEQEVFTEIEK